MPTGGAFDGLVRRRATGEPIPFIKGSTDFRGLDLLVRPGVFVPRDSSENLATQATRRLRGRRRPVHVDLATGAGTIALAVANEVPEGDRGGDRRVRGRGRSSPGRTPSVSACGRGSSPATCSAACRARSRAPWTSSRVHPPYVPMHELKDLPEEIREWEPEHTLTDRSRDGLGLIGRTAREAPAWLSPNGWLLMEVSPDRVTLVKRVLGREGFRDMRSTKGGPHAADEGDRRQAPGVTAQTGPVRHLALADQRGDGVGRRASRSRSRWLEDGSVYWLEAGPTEGGRSVLVRAAPFSEPVDVTPPGFNVRTTVHEYGGGAYLLHRRHGVLLATSPTNGSTARSSAPNRCRSPPDTGGRDRYADGRITPDGRWLICVRERHPDPDDPSGVMNELVAIPPDGSAEPLDDPLGPRLLLHAADLPRRLEALLARVGPPVDAVGRQRALRRGPRGDATLGNVRQVAGRAGEESIFQPAWSPAGDLHFVSDRTGWWNLYRERDGEVEALHPAEAEFGWPQWVFGMAGVRLPRRRADRVPLGARRRAARGAAGPGVGRADRPRRPADGDPAVAGRRGRPRGVRRWRPVDPRSGRPPRRHRPLDRRAQIVVIGGRRRGVLLGPSPDRVPDRGRRRRRSRTSTRLGTARRPGRTASGRRSS